MHELKRINPAQLCGQNFSAACSKWMAPQGPKCMRACQQMYFVLYFLLSMMPVCISSLAAMPCTQIQSTV